MIKIVQIEEQGILKIVTNEDTVSLERLFGSVDRRSTLVAMAEILIPIANDRYYKRTNPYKFDDNNSHLCGIYIEYAVPSILSGYNIFKKKLFRISNRDNVLELKDVFIYDLLDYLVYKGLVSKDCDGKYSISCVPVKYREIEYLTEENLIEKGFIIPR